MEQSEPRFFDDWVWSDHEAESDADRPFEFSIIRAEESGRIALLMLLVAAALAAPDLLTDSTLAFAGLLIAALLSLWTRFEARWSEYRRAGVLSNGAVVIVLGDFAWLGLLVAGTGGLQSPFAALLALPILFAVALFSRMKFAVMLVTSLVVTAYVGMATAGGVTEQTTWELAGALVSVMAIAWVSHGVCLVLERERRANELVIRNMSEALILLDNDRHIVVANKQIERFTGVTPSSIVGRHARQVVEDEAAEPLHPILQDVLQPLEQSCHVVRELTVNGPEPVDLRVSTSRCVSRGSESVGYVVVCQDVTPLKAAMRVKEKGLSMLSHEIRSPLTTLRVTASMISALAERFSNENMTHFAEVLDAETQRLVWVAGELLNVSTLEDDSAQIERRPTDIRALVTRLRRVIQLRAERKNVLVTGSCEGDLEAIPVDAERISSALNRLCDNALKYTGEGGEVSISAHRKNDLLTISVADTGVGIPADKRHLIFEKFAQLEEDTDRDRGDRGVGLGLYVARRIVELHNGEIHVSSEVGKGSIFTIELPVASEERVRSMSDAIVDLMAVEV